jgi:GNAT superfamily N-acetyltransferase
LSALMLRSKAHWGYDNAFLEACRHTLVVPETLIATGQVLVADDDGWAVGVAAVIGSAPEMELDVCFVEPVAMGAGVGRLLVDAASALARRQGAETMVVQSDPNAEPFYARLGAVRIGEVQSDIEAGRLLPLLRFELGPRE